LDRRLRDRWLYIAGGRQVDNGRNNHCCFAAGAAVETYGPAAGGGIPPSMPAPVFGRSVLKSETGDVGVPWSISSDRDELPAESAASACDSPEGNQFIHFSSISGDNPTGFLSTDIVMA